MTRPYRSIDFNDERKWKTTCLLDDVLQVGKQKAIGYVVEVPEYTIKPFDMQAVADQMSNEKKLVRIVDKDRLKLLWVGDVKMMRRIINKHATLIRTNGWPLLPEKFFDRISLEDISHHDNPDMYHVVCDLFNSWCLCCEVPVRKQCSDGAIRYYSANPYDPDVK